MITSKVKNEVFASQVPIRKENFSFYIFFAALCVFSIYVHQTTSIQIVLHRCLPIEFKLPFNLVLRGKSCAVRKTF